MEQEPIINVEELCFSYLSEEEEGALPHLILNHIKLVIHRGSFVVILGRNGSGKSTLAKHFNAINLPVSGKVWISGMDTADESSLLEIRRQVGMVFQNPDNQLVANVVEEDVAFAPENLGIPTPEIRKRVDDALETVGLSQFRAHAPHLLSGGQKQRLAIAGVLAMEPDCIVLDEPTAMLDPSGRAEVLETVHAINRERGVTVVLITHHMEEAVDADRVIVMGQGDILADGDPVTIFQQVELIREAGLDVPETVKLLYELKQSGWDIPLDGLSVDDCADRIATCFTADTRH